MFPLAIQAARLRLVRERPYLAAALWALQPVERPGLGTLAVDRWWRLYFDPAALAAWTVEEVAGVLYHEVCHLLREHPERMQNLDRRLANVAADAEVNDDLLAEGVRLPGQPITPTAIGQPDGLLAEEYYEALARTQESAPQQGTPAQPGALAQPGQSGAGEPEAGDTQQGDGNGQADGATAQDDASAPLSGAAAEEGSGPSPTAQGGGQAGSAQPGNRGDAGGSKPGGGEESNSSSPSGQPPAPSQPPAGPVSGRAGGQEGGSPGAGARTPAPEAETPAPGAGRCGSCATGQQEPWEDGPPGNGTEPGVSTAEAAVIRREVAVRIAEAAKSRGSVPDHLRRWAEEKLRSKIDWRRELAAVVRHAVADAAGAADYSYRRPSRRQGQVGNGKVILPALRQPMPRVAVVVDTSGSISDEMLSQALAEVAGVLRAAGQREGIHVLAVDAAVQSSRRIFRPEQVRPLLRGGGGTDMEVGLAEAARLRPRPEVAVVITDGYTPWPERAPAGMHVVVALIGDGASPSWARVVKVEVE